MTSRSATDPTAVTRSTRRLPPTDRDPARPTDRRIDTTAAISPRYRDNHKRTGRKSRAMKTLTAVIRRVLLSGRRRVRLKARSHRRRDRTELNWTEKASSVQRRRCERAFTLRSYVRRASRCITDARVDDTRETVDVTDNEPPINVISRRRIKSRPYKVITLLRPRYRISLYSPCHGEAAPLKRRQSAIADFAPGTR